MKLTQLPVLSMKLSLCNYNNTYTYFIITSHSILVILLTLFVTVYMLKQIVNVKINVKKQGNLDTFIFGIWIIMVMSEKYFRKFK